MKEDDRRSEERGETMIRDKEEYVERASKSADDAFVKDNREDNAADKYKYKNYQFYHSYHDIHFSLMFIVTIHCTDLSDFCHISQTCGLI